MCGWVGGSLAARAVCGGFLVWCPARRPPCVFSALLKTQRGPCLALPPSLAWVFVGCSLCGGCAPPSPPPFASLSVCGGFSFGVLLGSLPPSPPCVFSALLKTQRGPCLALPPSLAWVFVGCSLCGGCAPPSPPPFASLSVCGGFSFGVLLGSLPPSPPCVFSALLKTQRGPCLALPPSLAWVFVGCRVVFPSWPLSKCLGWGK